MQEEQSIEITEQKKRPQLLTILCILTFVGSGSGVAGFLMVSVNFESTMEALKVIYANIPEAFVLLNAPREFFVISLFLSVFSLLGAIMMWNLTKTGFHIYTSAQLISLIIPLIYFGGETNPLLNIMLTALFVYLYARNLPYMR
jgi:hypothetical protein